MKLCRLFYFETKECPKNRFVMTNAHFKYNARKRTEDYVSKKARFCLDSLDGKGWSCFLVDISEKNILTGWPKGQGDIWEDYLVAPFMEEKPSSLVVPTLVTLGQLKGEELGSDEGGLYYSGYYFGDKRMYSGTGCKISQEDTMNEGINKPIIDHNCPTIGGFSGAPLFYFDEEGKPKAFGVNFASSPSALKTKYDPMRHKSNHGVRVSPALIKKINGYCKSYLEKNPQ